MSFRSTIRSMVRNMKETFLPKTGMQKKQILQDPGHVKDIRDALLHAACSLQNTHRLPSVHLINFQLILSNVEDIEDNTTNDNRLHYIALSLFYFMLKMSEMCTKIVQITFCIIIQFIWIKKYFELVLQIGTYFELKPCVNLN